MRKTTDNATSRLLRLAEAAKYVSASTRLLRALVQEGTLPIVRLSPNDHAPWLVDRNDLDDLIEKRKTTL